MNYRLEAFEDRIREEKSSSKRENKYSKYCDFIYYQSTIHPEIILAMRVLKPQKPSYILATTHGWHMSIGAYCEYDMPVSEYLRVEVDMRGRAFSDGEADCNGWELYDIIDAVEYVKKHYQEYLISTETVYFEGGSGGGGNAYAIAGKFPDYFAHITAICGISDYEMWYQEDEIGEFRDELDVWIGPLEKEAYRSRSGITIVENLCTPISMVHGETDIRVPVTHARLFLEEAKRLGKEELLSYMELRGVGTREHWGNSTPEMLEKMENFCEEGRRAKQVPTAIPRRGKMVVAGYLFTREFSVIMDNLDKIATIVYDLDEHKLEVLDAYVGEYKAKWNK